MVSCQQGPKHPQADLINQTAPATLTPQETVQYADSIEAGLSALDKAVSLIYQSGEISFHVEKYGINGQPLVMVKQSNNEGIGSSIEKYYFKNDSLILIRQVATSTQSGDDAIKNKRIYLRNNIPFKEDIRTAATQKLINTLPFKEYRNAKPAATNYGDSISVMNDALAGTNNFEMIFDQYIAAEAVSFLLLKSKLPGGYTASVRVTTSDPLIDSVLRDPSVFKDTKLNFKWALHNNEVHYVPVPTRVTSASGLNK